MKKRAFTLIELLVVIAIIAILAAILFPVFAQAKASAKASADLAQLKQNDTAVFIYTGDSDDMLPLEASVDAGIGAWGWNYGKLVPWNWDTQNQGTTRENVSRDSFLNSMYPYTKNYQIYKSVGIGEYQDARVAGHAAVPGLRPEATNYAYNGLLTAYSSSAIADTARLPMITEANGSLASLGMGFSNPGMQCTDGTAPCTYQPPNGTTGACAPGNGGKGYMFVTFGPAAPYSSYWVNKEGQNWAYADGHAKFQPVGRTLAPDNTDYNTDPWTQYDATGHAGYFWWDGCHPWLFRPDYTFNYGN